MSLDSRNNASPRSVPAAVVVIWSLIDGGWISPAVSQMKDPRAVYAALSQKPRPRLRPAVRP
jgi:hypothetical protein